MALRISIKDLIEGNIVESQRIEFKEGWNPETILHTICAFANDYHNIGGGYIIIGIAEKEGLPILPPTGVEQSSLDKIQKEIFEKCQLLSPLYLPNIEVHTHNGKNIIVIQCLSGDARPYTAPEAISKGAKKSSYIRVGSITKRVTTPEETRQLAEISIWTPFDDRINHAANIDYIDISLIKQYLDDVKSPLLFDAKLSNSKLDLLESMDLMSGPIESRQLRNIALMLFCPYADRLFKGLGVEFIEFKDDNGTEYSEKTFTGPLHVQLREALTYFRNQILKEVVQKVPNQAASIRFYNYPYAAFEESLVNAVYHMSYEQDQKVEVRIFTDKIIILSYPGPLPPITQDSLKQANVTARRYRNRRLGDYLKELKLTEARATGIPTIRKSLKDNGSEPPLFETDEASTFFQTTLFIHEGFVGNATQAAVVPEKMLLSDLEQLILEQCLTPSTKKAIDDFVKSISKKYDKTKVDNAILGLTKRDMLVVVTTKVWFITISTFYMTTKLGQAGLHSSF